MLEFVGLLILTALVLSVMFVVYLVVLILSAAFVPVVLGAAIVILIINLIGLPFKKRKE